MSYSISVSGHGPVDDDLRAAFGELIRTLRAVTPEPAAGGSLGGSLYTGTATYAAADIPDEEPVDDEPTDEEDITP